ncbi:MAG: DUF4260 family protein [Chitinophagales bacterium]
MVLLTPDNCMAGYLINNQTGCFNYNLLQPKAEAIAIFIRSAF